MYEKQLQQLKELWDEGFFDVPFYRRRIDNRAVLDDYESFCKIPFMTKDDIRSTHVYERTSTKKEDVFGIFSSSGSTGEKTYYIFTKKDKEVQEICARMFLKGIGVNAGDLGGVFAPVETGIMAHTMMWQFSAVGAGYVNCPQPSPENMLSLLQKTPISVIATRPEVMSAVGASPEFVRSAQESSVRLLIPGGGFVCEARRKYLERIWNAQCYNLYGMSEVFGPMAGECIRRDGQHYPEPYLFIEVVDPDTGVPVESGKLGIAIYTTLWQKGFPLLRYWTDDFIRIDSSECGCGCKWPRFYYEGRRSDCLKIDGKYYFPKRFEELLMRYGMTEDYSACYVDGVIEVKIEGKEVPLTTEMEDSIIEFFGRSCRIELVKPGTLGIYRNHKNHFWEGTGVQ